MRATLRTMGIAAALLAGCGSKDGSSEQSAAPALASTSDARSTGPSGEPASPREGAAADAPAARGSGPIVDLSGAYRAPAALADGPRVYARAMSVPVQDKPDPSSKKIGFLRAGAAIAASAEPVGKAGCPGGWRAVQPSGYVCVGDKATTDPEDPIVRAMKPPDLSQRLPYMYGTVTRGGPVYSRIPTQKDLDEHEPSLDKHIKKWRDDKVSGASYGLELWYKWREAASVHRLGGAGSSRLSDDDIPWYLKDGGAVPDLSGLAKGRRREDRSDRSPPGRRVHRELPVGRPTLQRHHRSARRPRRSLPPHPRLASSTACASADVEFPFALVRKKGAKKWTWRPQEEDDRRRRSRVDARCRSRASRRSSATSSTTRRRTASGRRPPRQPRRPGQEDAQVGQERRKVDRRQHHEAGPRGLRGRRRRSTPRSSPR
jgi:hypothetical protein